MRTRRFASNERIRAKERRLLEVLRRQESARSLSVLPAGVIGSLSHTTSPGGTTSTINTPLLALVPTASETWQVDFATVPDSTGGFGNVTIEAGKQIAELDGNKVVTLTGQSVGNYVVYAQHSRADENAEVRQPPSKYAGGTGVFPEHRTFFGHGQSDGAPIPREGYDSTLSPETVSEAVDRLTIAFSAENSVPSDAVPLLLIVWNGSAIASVTDISRKVTLGDLYSHIGAGGSAHPSATISTAGFMSSTDKALLVNATSDASNSALMRRDASGRAKVAAPSVNSDIANKGYVDGAIAAATPTEKFDITIQGTADGYTVTGPTTALAMTTRFAIPDGYRLVLRRIRIQLSASSLRFQAGNYTNPNQVADAIVNHVEEANTSGNWALIPVSFRWVATASGTQVIGKAPDSAVATYVIEPIP